MTFSNCQAYLISKRLKHRATGFQISYDTSYGFFLISVSILEPSLLNCTACTRTTQTTLNRASSPCYTQHIKQDCVTLIDVRCFNVMIHAVTVVAVCGVMQWPFHHAPAVSSISGWELKTILSNRFTICKACHRVGESHYQHHPNMGWFITYYRKKCKAVACRASVFDFQLNSPY
jgi:hypothetical protein